MNEEQYINLMKRELGELDSDDYEVAKISAKFDYYSNKIGRML